MNKTFTTLNIDSAISQIFLSTKSDEWAHLCFVIFPFIFEINLIPKIDAVTNYLGVQLSGPLFSFDILKPLLCFEGVFSHDDDVLLD